MLIASIVRILLSLRPGESTSHPRVMSDLITKLKGLRGNGGSLLLGTVWGTFEASGDHLRNAC